MTAATYFDILQTNYSILKKNAACCASSHKKHNEPLLENSLWREGASNLMAFVVRFFFISKIKNLKKFRLL
ncbi:hypothetical protein D1BOALGB6SA_9727 [Olavius sp. associated proteobacterium Delta 1]|nr:hypothetical protein D1BOALGB6SA_9727 [Olavius sp. associated proteobacterium Delta 1]